ncbi:MAG TPA: hypothetical protein VFO86_02545, partial [Terriglobia bacterium]|nr:hypothetical protein [Terriglobia bacterium]
FLDKNSGFDLVILPRDGNGAPTNYLATSYNERVGSFSPNMKWIAYSSDESGKYQIYIAPFATGSGKWQVSVDGGDVPRWMNNGKRLYYFTNDDKIMGVDVNESGTSLSPGRPYPVFSPAVPIARLFDVNSSGTLVLASVPNSRSIPSPITLIDNWKQDAKTGE